MYTHFHSAAQSAEVVGLYSDTMMRTKIEYQGKIAYFSLFVMLVALPYFKWYSIVFRTFIITYKWNLGI